jgi:defect in organelle trafficking protein DotB
MTTSDFLFPQEPIRLSIDAVNEILMHAVKLGASDVTFQTGEPVFAEIYGRLKKVTRRKLSNTEVGEIINAMYGPNGMAQIMSGKDVDTHYEIRPNRSDRFRFRINGTG